MSVSKHRVLYICLSISLIMPLEDKLAESSRFVRIRIFLSSFRFESRGALIGISHPLSGSGVVVDCGKVKLGLSWKLE